MATNAVLSVSDVNKTFGGLRALNNINLQIEEGKTHAIIGPNGAGKSTLLNVCVGRLRPDTGSVNLNGTVLTGKKPHEINQLGVVRVFQTPEIFADLTLEQNVMVAGMSHREGPFRFNPIRDLLSERDLRDRARAVLEELDLIGLKDTTAASASRGDKRRLELAMGLIQEPKLLLLDEPTAGMSRHDTNRTIDVLKQFKQRGLTKVIIEHDMHVVFSLADKITVLSQGAIICEGAPEEVRGDPRVQEAYLGGAHL